MHAAAIRLPVHKELWMSLFTSESNKAVEESIS